MTRRILAQRRDCRPSVPVHVQRQSAAAAQGRSQPGLLAQLALGCRIGNPGDQLRSRRPSSTVSVYRSLTRLEMGTRYWSAQDCGSEIEEIATPLRTGAEYGEKHG